MLVGRLLRLVFVPDGVIMGFAAVSVYSLVPSFLLVLYAIVMGSAGIALRRIR